MPDPTGLPIGSVVRGQPFSYEFYYEVAGVAVNWTGWTAAAIAKDYNGEVLATLAPTLPSAGHVVVAMSGDETSLLPDPQRPGHWPGPFIEFTLSGPSSVVRLNAPLWVAT